MASNHIPYNVILLAAYMERIERGDDLHKGDKPLSPIVRARLERGRKRLQASTKRVKDAEAEVAKARQALREDRNTATVATRCAREGVYALWTTRSGTVTDYGLRPYRSGRPRKGG